MPLKLQFVPVNPTRADAAFVDPKNGIGEQRGVSDSAPKVVPDQFTFV